MRSMKPAFLHLILLAVVGSFLSPALLPAATTTFVLAYRQADAPEPIDTAAAYQAASKVIRFHLNELGTKYKLELHPHEIVVQVRDAKSDLLTRIRQILERSGRVEFRRVHVDSPAAMDLGEKADPASYEALTIEYASDSGIDHEVLWVEKLPAMTSRSIREAEPRIEPSGNFKVVLSLNESGRTRFSKLTQELADELQRDGRPRRIALVLDGKIISAPRIMQALDTDVLEIAGRFTEREALELCMHLNTPMDQPSIIEQRTE